jgi:putative flippase GtrA
MLRYARRTLPRVLQFALAGLPAFALAVPFNYALVKWAGVPIAAAYACVLLMQVPINFFMCRRFVFASDAARGLWRSLFLFTNGILAFRVLDWALYWLLADRFGLPFIGVQLFNVGLFSLLKFEFSRRVFEREKRRQP